MDFRLSYDGNPGEISATLREGGRVVGSAQGLATGKAARKWARKAARDYRVENTPEASESETVFISGDATFTL